MTSRPEAPFDEAEEEEDQLIRIVPDEEDEPKDVSSSRVPPPPPGREVSTPKRSFDVTVVNPDGSVVTRRVTADSEETARIQIARSLAEGAVISSITQRVDAPVATPRKTERARRVRSRRIAGTITSTTQGVLATQRKAIIPPSQDPEALFEIALGEEADFAGISAPDPRQVDIFQSSQGDLERGIRGDSAFATPLTEGITPGFRPISLPGGLEVLEVLQEEGRIGYRVRWLGEVIDWFPESETLVQARASNK